MISRTNKEIYKIYKKMMYSAEYRTMAKRYTESVDILQVAAQTFSEDQWRAVKNYQTAFMALHNEMMRIALQKK